ncbi:uncharacterized protein [Dermacentor andersoni]|uniref:uncharacterized protein isoform X1 n=1 Tax=Dermacentor andersoni TaxID=34620 RepID=UPI002416B1D4|nr:uncharacterized protein LOC126516269 isoform X1 [Dermacentor andersoni]
MKHRNHPGARKRNQVKLPEKLIDAAKAALEITATGGSTGRAWNGRPPSRALLLLLVTAVRLVVPTSFQFPQGDMVAGNTFKASANGHLSFTDAKLKEAKERLQNKGELQHRSVPSFGLFADASSNKRAQINIDIGDGVYVEKGLLKKLRLDPNNSGLQSAVSLVKALLTKDVEGRSFFGRPSNAFHRRIRWIPRSTPHSTPQRNISVYFQGS